MLMTRSVARMFAVGLMVLGGGVASSQGYPNRPIRVLAVGPGGGSDIAARLIAQGLTSSLGQQVIVDNRAGVIPGEIVSRASPDGYTLLVAGSSFWTAPLLQKTPYDPVRDFSTISLTNQAPNILVVHPPLPVKSVKELIALAKAKPGEINSGTGAAGSSSFLAAALFNTMAGVNIVRINFKSESVALIDVIGGQVQLAFPSAGGFAPHMKSGRLRALAVASAKPSALLPDLPTIAATGLPGYESVSYNGVFAPAGTPEAIIKRLNHEIVRILGGAEVKEKFFNIGVEPLSSSPQEFAATVKTEMTRSGKLIKDIGIKVQ